MGIGTKIIEAVGGATSKSSWRTIGKTAATKAADQIKNAPPAAKVGGAAVVGAAGYKLVAAPTRDHMALTGQMLYARSPKGAFGVDVVGVDRRYYYGLVEGADHQRHFVRLPRRKVRLFEDEAMMIPVDWRWKLSQSAGYFSRRREIKALRTEAKGYTLERLVS